MGHSGRALKHAQKNTTTTTGNAPPATTARNTRATTKRLTTKTVRFEDHSPGTPPTVGHDGMTTASVAPATTTKNTTRATTKRISRNRGTTKATVTNKKILLGNSRLVVSHSIKKNEYKDLVPEEIIGVTRKYPQLMFVVKWKNIENPVLVESLFMNMHHPSTVIKYYESIIQWQNKINR